MTKQLFRYEIELVSYDPSEKGGVFGVQVDKGDGFTIISGGFRRRAWALIIWKKDE